MRIEVDQSGKVENTQTDTVLAFSDGKSYSIVIPAQLKREWFVVMEEAGRSKRSAYLLLFSIGLFLLLKPVINKNVEIVIDKEYPGREKDIKAMLLRYFWNSKIAISEDQISFELISRASNAHEVAHAAFRERAKVGEVIGKRELFRFAK